MVAAKVGYDEVMVATAKADKASKAVLSAALKAQRADRELENLVSGLGTVDLRRYGKARGLKGISSARKEKILGLLGFAVED